MKKFIAVYLQLVLLTIGVIIIFTLTFAPFVAPLILVIQFKLSPLWFLLNLIYLFVIPFYVCLAAFIKGDI